MKVSVIQPKYSTDFSKSDEYFQKQIELLNGCGKDTDIIVLPESADCPCLAKNEAERKEAFLKFNADIKQFKAYAPDIAVCIGHDFSRNWAIVDRAIELGVERLQFYKPYYNQEMVDKAHAHGIICNVCWSNTREETEHFVKMGMDVILTDEFKRVQNWVKEFAK